MELFGGAGHSKEIAKRISSNGMLIGIDRDQEALKAAQNNLKEFHNIKYVHDNHDNIKNILEKLNIANGDFARTSDSWANQTRVLSLRFNELKATLGQGFINIFTPIVKGINWVLSKLQVLANAFKSFTEMIFGNAGR